jgi:hypothetical protein
MGFDLCCQKKLSKKELYSFAPTREKEILRIKYKSNYDFLFEELEHKYNILGHIQLIDYVNLLNNYEPETATLNLTGVMKKDYSHHDYSLSYVMTVDIFQNFIENKLYKTSEIIQLSEKKELMLSTFTEVCREIFNSLELKLNQHYEEKRNDRITKKILISLGVLYCKSDVIGKIKLIYDLFKNDKDKFVKSEDFEKYLISSFLICSYCMLSVRKKIIRANKKIPEMKEEDFINCLKVCQLKISQNLLKIFNENFFDKDEFDWNEFKNKFNQKENGFQWILSPKGIRKMLEENIF